MTSGPQPAGWKRMRTFLMVRRRDGGGRLVKYAQIACIDCGEVGLHLKRGNQDSQRWFERHGWHVGNNAAHDRCAACTAFAKRKVIKMSDHKPAPPPMAVVTTPDKPMLMPADRRVISRSVEDHWNEANACYEMGWSDAKMADHLGVPVDWVKEVRTLDFGGSGDDPTVETFIATHVEIRKEMAALSTLINMATKDLSSSTMFHNELAKKLEGYRNGHRRLLDKVERLDQIVATLKPVKRSA